MLYTIDSAIQYAIDQKLAPIAKVQRSIDGICGGSQRKRVLSANPIFNLLGGVVIMSA